MKITEYDKAIADYSECIRLDPKHANAFLGRGLAWSYKNEIKRAIDNFDHAIHLDRECAAAFAGKFLHRHWLGINHGAKVVFCFAG